MNAPRDTSYDESLRQALADPKEAAAYLDAVMEREDAAALMVALRQVAKPERAVDGSAPDKITALPIFYGVFMKAGAKNSNISPIGEFGMVSVSFGSVTVKVHKPTESVRKANIEAGQKALQRGKSALIKPGVKLARQKGVPLYFGCEDRPGWMVRELDGKRTIGRFVGCRFIADKAKSTNKMVKST